MGWLDLGSKMKLNKFFYIEKNKVAPCGSDGKDSTCNQKTRVWSLEKGMTTHSSILTWKIPRTEEPGGKLITWITALSNSIKLWAMQCRATQDRWIMVESSDKTWSTGEGMTNHFSILALRTPRTVWKGKKTWICLWGSKNLWIFDLEALGAGQHLVLVHMGWNPYIAIILM